MRPGRCVGWYLAGSNHRRTADFPGRRSCPHCLLRYHLLRPVDGRHRDSAVLSSARISADWRQIQWFLLVIISASSELKIINSNQSWCLSERNNGNKTKLMWILLFSAFHQPAYLSRVIPCQTRSTIAILGPQHTHTWCHKETWFSGADFQHQFFVPCVTEMKISGAENKRGKKWRRWWICRGREYYHSTVLIIAGCATRQIQSQVSMTHIPETGTRK